MAGGERWLCRRSPSPGCCRLVPRLVCFGISPSNDKLSGLAFASVLGRSLTAWRSQTKGLNILEFTLAVFHMCLLDSLSALILLSAESADQCNSSTGSFSIGWLVGQWAVC